MTASVTDSAGGADSDSIQVVVTLPGAPPSVTITAPASGTSVSSGTSVTLEGTATDPEDGDLTTAIEWVSDRDGSLGTGGSVSVVLSDGVHVITASVVDSHGRQGTDSITVTVEGSVSVSAIDQAGFGGKNANKHLRVSIGVVDANGAGVSGATVSLTLMRGSSSSMGDATAYQSTFGTTDGGTLSLTFKNIPSGCYRVVVTDISADGASWDGSSPSPNPDPWCT